MRYTILLAVALLSACAGTPITRYGCEKIEGAEWRIAGYSPIFHCPIPGGVRVANPETNPGGCDVVAIYRCFLPEEVKAANKAEAVRETTLGCIIEERCG